MSRKKKVSYYIETIEKDDYVKYTGCSKEQVRWGNNDTPYMLIVGRTYTISWVEVHSQHTKVSIKGVDDNMKFNSVHFCHV